MLSMGLPLACQYQQPWRGRATAGTCNKTASSRDVGQWGKRSVGVEHVLSMAVRTGMGSSHRCYSRALTSRVARCLRSTLLATASGFCSPRSLCRGDSSVRCALALPLHAIECPLVARSLPALSPLCASCRDPPRPLLSRIPLHANLAIAGTVAT